MLVSRGLYKALFYFYLLTVDREIVTMVVVIGRIVAEICFKRKMRIGSRSYWLLAEACRSLAISVIDADKAVARGSFGCLNTQKF